MCHLHSRSLFFISAGIWWFGLDSSCIDTRGPTEPSGVGDVRLCFLLRHDLPLDDHLRCRRS